MKNSDLKFVLALEADEPSARRRIEAFASEIAKSGSALTIVHPKRSAGVGQDGAYSHVPVDAEGGSAAKQVAWNAALLLQKEESNLIVARGLRSAWSLSGNARARRNFIAWLPSGHLMEELSVRPDGKGALRAIAEAAKLLIVDDEASLIAVSQAMPKFAVKVFVLRTSLRREGSTPYIEGLPNVMTPSDLLRFLTAERRVLIFDDHFPRKMAHIGDTKLKEYASLSTERTDPGDSLFEPAEQIQFIRLIGNGPQLESAGTDSVRVAREKNQTLSVRPVAPDKHMDAGRLLPRYAPWHLAVAAELLECDLVLPTDIETAIWGASNDVLADRMWPCFDFETWSDVESLGLARLEKLFNACRRIILPTEGSRAILESRIPGTAGKCVVHPWAAGFGQVGDGNIGASSFERLVDRYAPRRSGSVEKRRKVLFAGHDFKFAGELVEQFSLRNDVEVRFDKWERQNQQDETASREALKWADTVICEFASHNAVWYSWEKRSDQQLLVHFHGYELRSDWIQNINVASVDAFIFVSDFYRNQAIAELGWDNARTVVIPNMIDIYDLRRPKLDDSRFHLGIAGIVPILKRPDRALDLLEELLAVDERYTLHVRGRDPWEYGWMWQSEEVRDAYEAFYERLVMDPSLRRSVSFDGFGPDMGRWFQKIGWMLSPSTRETFHLAPIEGMASGAVPVVWSRRGANELFGTEWVHDDTKAAARYIATTNNTAELFAQSSTRAIEAIGRFDVDVAIRDWTALVLREPEVLNVDPDVRISAERAEILFKTTPDSTRLGWLLRVLQREGETARIERLLEEFPELFRSVSPEIAAPILMSQGLKRLACNRQLLPARSRGAVYFEKRDSVLNVQARSAGDEKMSDSLSLDPPHQGLSGRNEVLGQDRSLPIDKFIIASADVIVREARVRRPAAIAGRGDCWVVYAGLIAARRLGVPFAAYVHETSRALEPNIAALLEAEADVVIKDGGQEDWLRDALQNYEDAADATEQLLLGNLRIGLIADEFTSNTVSRSFEAVPLRRRDGYLQVAVEKLDAVFIESAWEGPNDEWRRGVAYNPEKIGDLKRIIEVAKHKGIPVLFWNKEDPVHFHNFSKTAALVDHVFTTDGDLVPDYLALAESEIQTASAIPFYAQPKIHNPLSTNRTYEHTVAYAGTYYGDRFKERSEELRRILGVAAKYGLTVYDRQVNVLNSPYHFPSDLAKFVRPGVPYGEVLDVYKGHPVNINVNSAQNSSTMFSRRVVEIAASGGVVLSGRGRGINEQLGGIPATADPEFWDEKLALWMSDEGARLTEAWDQLRCVVRSHLADQALTLLFRTAGLPVRIDGLPDYAILVPVLGESEYLHITAQTWLPKAVIIGGAHADLDPEFGGKLEAAGVSVCASVDALPEGIDWVADGVPSNRGTYFEDVLHATRFGEWSSIGAVVWTNEMPAGETLASIGLKNEVVLLKNRRVGDGSQAQNVTWLLPPDGN